MTGAGLLSPAAANQLTQADSVEQPQQYLQRFMETLDSSFPVCIVIDDDPSNASLMARLAKALIGLPPTNILVIGQRMQTTTDFAWAPGAAAPLAAGALVNLSDICTDVYWIIDLNLKDFGYETGQFDGTLIASQIAKTENTHIGLWSVDHHRADLALPAGFMGLTLLAKPLQMADIRRFFAQGGDISVET